MTDEGNKKEPAVKLTRKERRQRWKQKKQERRQTLKEYYRDAPWIVRVPRLYLLKPFLILLVIAVLGFGAWQVGSKVFFDAVDANKNAPVAQEKIEALAPIDQEGAERIDATAPVDPEDTWTICVYICASDLEDRGENDLSAVVRKQIEGEQAKLAAAAQENADKRLDRFTGELKENNLDMPAYLYYPSKPTPAEKESRDPDHIVAEDPGSASTDIGEMTAEKWSENISIVIQTGGATRWSNPMVNPNRTQRFLYRNGEFTEVYDAPLQRVTDPKTLTSFLKFCRKSILRITIC